MGLLNRIKMLWRAAVGSSYSWPAMDIVLPGERYLHLVGSIHMGTRDMAPPPAKLLKKIRQADALIVEADISGNIWKLLVEPGQSVKAGEPLLIVEAMKMEFSIYAPVDGVVSRISCKAGRPVQAGDALLYIEAGEPELVA